MITSQVVIAYTQCKLKAYLLLCTNKKGIPHEYISSLADEARKNREEYIRRIKLTTSEVFSYPSERFKRGNSIIVGAHLEFDDLRAYSDVLTRLEETSSTNQPSYTPTLVVGTHNISKAQRLQLAFIGYVLSKCQNEKPASATIVGGGNKTHRIKLDNLYNEIEVVLNKLRTWTSSQKPESPPVILNKHCLSCPFQQECETGAKEHDHLSLLRGMTEREIKFQNKKGIFTVNQFSYTYRPRKRKKTKEKHYSKYHHSLKALAIRDHKIYIVQKPKVPLSGTLIFLDVEGIPDQSFYYLIGLVVVEGASMQNYSFWADTIDNEGKIWKEFLSVVNRYHECPVFHYGSYETKFIETMSKRYTEDNEGLFKKPDTNLVNTLSLMYGNIYFPTYSNNLKDIGAYLGQKWSEEHATGLQSLFWRYEWETSGDESFKKRLIQYNLEDCLALKAVTEAVMAISNEHTASNTPEIASIDDIKVETPFTFGNTQYLFKELEFVNKCAYFDYQREKIYLRTNENIQKALKHQKKRLKYANKVDKTVNQIPERCPNCNRHITDKCIPCKKIVIELKFIKNGIKKWVVEYKGARCHLCGKMITSKNLNVVRKKYGHNLLAWSTNQYITYRIPLNTISHILLESFKIKVNDNCIYKFRETLSKAYQETYMEIRQTVILKCCSKFMRAF